MVRFEIRPLAGWDKPKTERPSRSMFKVGWEETIDALKREVELLGGNVIAAQIDAPADAIRRDGMIRAAAKVGFQGVKISFVSRHGPLTYATDRYDRWKDNVRAITLGLGALRAVDRYGITESGQQYVGWAALPSTPYDPWADGDPISAAIKVFGQTIGDDAFDADLGTKDGVAKAYRSAARRHHPDRGGSDAVMATIAKARDVLLAAAR
jgi:hypothetical protein